MPKACRLSREGFFLGLGVQFIKEGPAAGPSSLGHTIHSQETEMSAALSFLFPHLIQSKSPAYGMVLTH